MEIVQAEIGFSVAGLFLAAQQIIEKQYFVILKGMRKILAVILGALVGKIILFMVGIIANAIQPTPPELMNPATPEAVARRVDATTTFAWLSTIFGLALGAFIGGCVGTIIAKEKRIWVSSAIGLVLSPWAFYTFYIVFPEVLWVPFAMLISVLLFSYLGGIIMMQLQQKKYTIK